MFSAYSYYDVVNLHVTVSSLVTEEQVFLSPSLEKLKHLPNSKIYTRIKVMSEKRKHIHSRKRYPCQARVRFFF